MGKASNRTAGTTNKLEQLRAHIAALEEALRLREVRVAEAQQVAHMGNWDLNLQTGVMTWSKEIYRIFDLGKL